MPRSWPRPSAKCGPSTSNFFPGMKVSWRASPDNIGHLDSDGCCSVARDGQPLYSAGGKPISRGNFQACHNIIAQGKGKALATVAAPQGLPFKHPEDVGGCRITSVRFATTAGW